jgi:hypothetical protein
MPGFTAWYGLLKIGKPKARETLVVSAATGAVGSVVGQIAKTYGCRVVGIAGGQEKCRYAVEMLGFDACLDRFSPTFAADLAAAAPHGIDISYENAGGEIFESIWPMLNIGARVVVCGLISHYNSPSEAVGPDRLPATLMHILRRRIKVEGFIILDHYAEYFDTFYADMSKWLTDGSIAYREHVTEGIENTAQAFLDMLEGRNFGKAVVRVAADH